MENRSDNVGRFGGTIGRNSTDRIAGSDDTASLDATSCESDCKATGPVIPSTGWIDFRSSAKLSDIANQGIVEHPLLEQVLDQR